MKQKYRHVIKPSRRLDYAAALRTAFRDEWVEVFGITKTDISQMSLKSLKEISKKIDAYNFLKSIGVKNADQLYATRKTAH